MALLLIMRVPLSSNIPRLVCHVTISLCGKVAVREVVGSLDCGDTFSNWCVSRWLKGVGLVIACAVVTVLRPPVLGTEV